jgi:hypothetical protein
MLEFEKQKNTLTVYNKDADGEVELVIEDGYDSCYFYLTQDEIKQLIKYLTSQIY